MAACTRRFCGDLHVNVLSGPDRRQGRDGVRVIGRGHDNRIDALLLLEHDPEIPIAASVRVLLERLGSVFTIHIAMLPQKP